MRWIYLIALVSLPFLAIGREDAKEDDQKNPDDANSDAVHVLTNSNFDQFVSKNNVVLVEFYAPWCGHCKRLEPEYSKAAAMMKTKPNGVPLGKVDATQELDLAKKYDIRGYPSLKLFRKGKPQEYEGGRTAEAIVSWIEKMTGPAVEEFKTLQEAQAAAGNESVTYIGHFTAKSNPAYAIFESVADSNRTLGKFFVTFADGAKNEVSVYRNQEEPVTHKVGTEEDLVSFVRNEHFPLFGPIAGDNFASYFSLNKELVWFVGDDNHSAEAAPIMRTVAKKYRDDYSFVSLDADKYGGHAENALGVSGFPSLVYQSKKGRYIYPSQDFTSAQKLIDFFEDVKAGKIERNLKSEPVPEAQEGPIRVVVGKTFEATVFSQTADVMLEVYAPSCGHCKKLEPIYEEFATTVAGVDGLIVAKMDGTANESPIEDFDWTGFPTIFFVKAGQKKPMKYDGARTVEGFMEYIKKHGSKEFSIPEKTGKDKEKDEL